MLEIRRLKVLALGLATAAALMLVHEVKGQAIPLILNRFDYIPPLVRAVLTRDPQLVSKVLTPPEDINGRVKAKEGTRGGFTPLIVAASISDPEITQMLVRRGAKADVFDDFHRSAFWYAALNESVDVTTALLEASGAREAVDAADDDLKRTPLHLAVRANEPIIVKLLLSIGASREQKDVLGETPVDYCKLRATDACGILR